MYIKWFFLAIAELSVSLFTVLFSWLLALFYKEAESNKWCIAKGPRQYLIGPLQLFSTWDDGVDAGWYKGLYDDRVPSWSNPEKARQGNWLEQYKLRVWWLVRNSAYGFAHYFFGFKRGPNFTTVIKKKVGVWDSGNTNYEYRIDTTEDGRQAWLFRGQFYYTKKMFVRVQLGWKLTWREEVVQIATHINPLRGL